MAVEDAVGLALGIYQNQFYMIKTHVKSNIQNMRDV